jgi:hypothetical protein
MSALPSRTVVMQLDETAARRLAEPEPGAGSYDVGTVRRRFMERLRPQLAAELRDQPDPAVLLATDSGGGTGHALIDVADNLPPP